MWERRKRPIDENDGEIAESKVEDIVKLSVVKQL